MVRRWASDPWQHLGISELWRTAVEEDGIAVAATAMVLGAVGALVVVAVALAGPVAGIYLAQDTEPVFVVLAAAASVMTVLVADRLWKMLRPLRAPLLVVMVRRGYPPPNTVVRYYIVAGSVAFRAKHALLEAGFEYVGYSPIPGASETESAHLQARIRVDPDAGVGANEAQARAEELFHQRGIAFRIPGQ